MVVMMAPVPAVVMVPTMVMMAAVPAVVMMTMSMPAVMMAMMVMPNLRHSSLGRDRLDRRGSQRCGLHSTWRRREEPAGQRERRRETEQAPLPCRLYVHGGRPPVRKKTKPSGSQTKGRAQLVYVS